MAEITRRLHLRHIQGTPTTWIQRLRNGRVADEGIGIRFWFRPINTEISEVPVDERELPLVFHARTEDFQDVSVQATITWRIADPERTVGRIDFSIDTDLGLWRGAPLEQIAGLLTELAQQYAIGVLARLDLTSATVDGPAQLRGAIDAGLTADRRLDETGIHIVGVRVMAVRPSTDLEHALQTPVAERLQQDADRARYERRATAVEHERAISENEMQNEIELARRKEELVRQEGQNERMRMAEESEALRIRSEATARDRRVATAVEAEAIRAVGDARAEAEAASLAAVAELSEGTLLALAARELAGNVPAIDTLVLTPDLLTPLLGRLLGDPVAPSGAGAAPETAA